MKKVNIQFINGSKIHYEHNRPDEENKLLKAIDDKKLFTVEYKNKIFYINPKNVLFFEFIDQETADDPKR
ncbi:hypothetical protein [Streptococcus constellatus]|uniref:hypothetical protein n=1 Tax=Streptococcus constellatus TaxID=76860 RepID=UPI0020006917|nr:hypothetical protein [Streptococcus constellatus]